ncbi:PD-(D/E)XK nuclease superfamily protein [Ruminobacter amylophilus]|uniref:PD-(D/E)XK nuclease superfamily protein n=1 Tax=Ruminobacter amylophilus TaxID=867 RepID=A0A662ZG12_9GAMM|nr:AAA family ATPase [Ruminobacter amylophilus]SFP03835.1 PD-(D/E)XK nuclease superfamily protein [Ruminobacter amylophilus]
MKSCKEMSAVWSISERRVREFCEEGKIPGAVKLGRQWQIPDGAERPADSRIVTGRYVKSGGANGRKPLPVGISDYIRAQSEYYYVDKTLLIRDFLDRKALVSLFTRPRRFGKTLNMDMLRVFFEISDEDTGRYFADKAIWQCGEEYRCHQGKYPVIFLTFKDVKYDSWQATFAKISGLLQEEFGRHSELGNSDRLAKYEKEYFEKVLNGEADEVELSSSLQKLSKMLTVHYNKAPIIIIDEYDTPIQEGYSKEFYDEIVGFMRNFFSGAFKDNSNLSYGFLTGILRIAQESIFSGLNNLAVSSVMDEEYDGYFGFTKQEVGEMLSYYGASDKADELRNWYDGYFFGSKEIYNPWSVINYLSKGCLPQAYWVNTGKNEVLEDVLDAATDDISEKLYSLLRGEPVIARIDQNVVYRSLADDPANIYSLLLVAGYLKTVKKVLQGDGAWLCEVAIPNRETAAVYKSEILSHLMQIGAMRRATANKIAESLYARDTKKLQDGIEEYMKNSISFYDAGAEGFYHGLVLGLIALMDNQYRIRSNRESGDGRYDICMIPRDNKYPAILMELKWNKELNEENLDALSAEALNQINVKGYDAEIRTEGIADNIKFGIAFSGKKVKIRTE